MPDREKVISNLEQQIRWIEEIECHQFPGWLNVTNAMRDALALLKEQETANLYKCPNCGTWVSAENVVRCKDCKHAGTFNGANGEKCFYCTKYAGYILNDWVTDGDWFCADAERRE